MQAVELIKQIPLFKGLEDGDARDLAAATRLMSLKPGQPLFHKGDEGTALYILRKGTIKIVLPSRIGDEIIVTILSDGEYFGEMALLDGEPRSADAIAIDASQVVILRRNDFLLFLQSNLNAMKSILALLSRRLRSTDEMLEDTCFLSVSVRLAKKLVELAASHGSQAADKTIHIELTLTQKELGDMIGATRESINKELRTLREKGLIKKEGNNIRILDMDGLKRKFRAIL